METLDYAGSPARPRQRNPLRILLWIILIAALISIGILILSMSQEGTMVASHLAPVGLRPAIETGSATKFDVNAVLNERVEPALQVLQKRNSEAVQRAIAKIHGHFDSARKGAPDFAESIIGPFDATKTTYLAGKGMVLRWWYHDSRIQPVADHVRWNYEQHVTSGPKIRDAILGAIAELEQELRADRNEALQAIGSSLQAAHLPASVEIDEKQLDEYCQHEFEASIAGANTDHIAEKAAVGSAAAFAFSMAATIIAERAIMFVLGKAVATAGGAVIAGTAGGAAAGSWAPGVGNAIGAASGLLGGIAVDAWISHENKERTTKQVTTSLTQIENAIIHGDGKHPGVERVLSDAASRQGQQLRVKLEDQLKEAAQ